MEMFSLKGLRMKYFVLKPGVDSPFGKASRMAMLAYAKEIKWTDEQLSAGLEVWVGNIRSSLELQMENEK